MDIRHGRNGHAWNTCTEDRKKNIWNRKRELWRLRTNKEIKAILQVKYIIKFREFLQQICYGNAEKKAKPKIAKTNCNSYNGRKKKGEIPCKRWREEV